jgi:hypothetical protein
MNRDFIYAYKNEMNFCLLARLLSLFLDGEEELKQVQKQRFKKEAISCTITITRVK